MEPYQELEKRIEEWLGIENVVACSSGTAALHLALEALQLPQGSEIITSDFNMIAVPRAIVMAGMKPAFWDCGEDLLMDMGLLPRGNGIRRCFLMTHIYGRRCDMKTLQAWRENWLSSPTTVIEDMAELHGVKPHKNTDAACWSFYKNKIVAGEEGGAVAFKNPDHAKLARQLRSLGFTDAHDFNHIPRGHNYRMSNVHASLILKSLARYNDNKWQREAIASLYDFACLAEWRMPSREAHWVYDLRIKGMSREMQGRIVKELNKARIPARHAFKPMSLQAEFFELRKWANGSSTAEVASREVFYLPILPGATDGTEVKRAFDVIHRVLASC